MNPPYQACLFCTDKNIPEHQQHALIFPHRGNQNFTRYNAREKDDGRYVMAKTAELLKSTEN